MSKLDELLKLDVRYRPVLLAVPGNKPLNVRL